MLSVVFLVKMISRADFGSDKITHAFSGIFIQFGCFHTQWIISTQRICIVFQVKIAFCINDTLWTLGEVAALSYYRSIPCHRLYFPRFLTAAESPCDNRSCYTSPSSSSIILAKLSSLMIPFRRSMFALAIIFSACSLSIPRLAK